MFIDMKDEVSTSSDYKSCIKFVGRCEGLVTTAQFDIEGNYLINKFRVAEAVPRCPEEYNCWEMNCFGILLISLKAISLLPFITF